MKKHGGDKRFKQRLTLIKDIKDNRIEAMTHRMEFLMNRDKILGLWNRNIMFHHWVNGIKSCAINGVKCQKSLRKTTLAKWIKWVVEPHVVVILQWLCSIALHCVHNCIGCALCSIALTVQYCIALCAVLHCVHEAIWSERSPTETRIVALPSRPFSTISNKWSNNVKYRQIQFIKCNTEPKT